MVFRVPTAAAIQSQSVCSATGQLVVLNKLNCSKSWQLRFQLQVGDLKIWISCAASGAVPLYSLQLCKRFHRQGVALLQSTVMLIFAFLISERLKWLSVNPVIPEIKHEQM